jgi:hypothetical protein
MRDSETVILEELDRLSPVDELAAPDWGDAVRRAGLRRRLRRRALLAIPVAFLAVSLPAVALSSGLRSALGLGRPQPVVDHATLLVSAPVGNGFYAHAARAPSTTGGTCVFLTYNHTAGTPHSADWNRSGSSVCTTTARVSLRPSNERVPLAPGLSIGRRAKSGNPRNWVPPVVFGSVYSKLHATRVAVEWKGGSHELLLRNGWFLGGTPALYMPSFAEFPFVVVAYDAHGKAVARKKLESPSLLLLRAGGGWKEYAREYHAWQKQHRR